MLPVLLGAGLGCLSHRLWWLSFLWLGGWRSGFRRGLGLFGGLRWCLSDRRGCFRLFWLGGWRSGFRCGLGLFGGLRWCLSDGRGCFRLFWLGGLLLLGNLRRRLTLLLLSL